MSQRFLYLFVFFTGATVMSTEMTASRLIAPYFGTSIIVWANIIGIILLAMSAGYFFGGRLADRHPEPKILFSLSIVAGLILTAIPLISLEISHFLTGGILATPISITITDDRVPVEFLTDQMIWDTLRGSQSPDSLQLSSLANTDKSNQTSSTTLNPSLTEQQLTPQSSPNIDNASISSSLSLDLSPKINSDALELYEQGLKLYYKREFSQALTFFNKALAKDTRCYQALNAKGATYAFQGKYDEGLALIKQALEINPNFVYGHFNLGLANELAGRWDPAISAYQEALRLDKQDVWSYYGIASIYGRMGNAAKVLEYLEQAIALDPGVKEVAREEKDFDPVRQDPRFQKLVTPTE